MGLILSLIYYLLKLILDNNQLPINTMRLFNSFSFLFSGNYNTIILIYENGTIFVYM